MENNLQFMNNSNNDHLGGVDNNNNNASFVAMNHQMMPPVALGYSSAPAPLPSTTTTEAEMSFVNIPSATQAPMINHDYNSYQTYVQQQQQQQYHHHQHQPLNINTTVNATATPIVKSHSNAVYSALNNVYNQQQANYLLPLDTTTTNIMNNFGAMDIDDYFTSTATMNMDTNTATATTTATNMFMNNTNIYSPSSTSVTTVNSSVIMMSPTSPTPLPTHMLNNQNTTNMIMSPPPPSIARNTAMDTASFVTPMPFNGHQQQQQHSFLLNHDNHQQMMYPAEAPIVPTNIGMNYNYHDDSNMMYTNPVLPSQAYMAAATTDNNTRKGRRSLPRRHTVSTPYATSNVISNNSSTTTNLGGTSNIKTKDNSENKSVISDGGGGGGKAPSRKSSLKTKRHRSLGKLDIFGATSSSTGTSSRPSSPPPIPNIEPLLSAKLELWTHEQLLERVMELEKEKEVSVTLPSSSLTGCGVATTMNEVTLDENAAANNNMAFQNARSASHTDTEVDDEDLTLGGADEDEEPGPQVCKWENCTLELPSLDELIHHVKIDHIGSGKANYYCCWKDCARNQKPFTKRHKMHNHLRTHTGERPFVCQEPDCGKKFSRPDSLTTHAKIHSNIRPYLCNNPDCGKAYYHLRSLRKHERSHLVKEDGSTGSPPPEVPPLPTTLPSPPLLQQQANVVVQQQQAYLASSLQSDSNSSNGIVTQQQQNKQEEQQQQQEEIVFSDWGLSAQAAVFNILDRDNSFM